jgi:hypothetical protein
MRAQATVSVLIVAGLALSACSSEQASSPSSSATPSATDRQAAIGGDSRTANDSGVRPAAVQNELRPWWDSTGIPVTWKVSEVDNHDWDGDVRPDHAPPNGFQGLKQEAFSGPYRVPLVWNTKGFEIRFVLTPVTTIDGESVVLQPITFTGYATTSSGWYMAAGDTRIQCSRSEPSSYAVTTWQQSPRGTLKVIYDLACSKDLATVAL